MKRLNTFSGLQLSDSKTELFSKKKRRNVPFLPAIRASNGHQRGPLERVFLVLDNPGESYLGFCIFFVTIAAIVLSTAASTIATIPHYQNFKPECEVCGPVPRNSPPRRHDQRADLETFCTSNDCEPGPPDVFDTIEFWCIVVFTVDYGIRLATSVFHRLEAEDSIQFRLNNHSTAIILLFRFWKFISSPLNVVDLLAILPFWIQCLWPDMWSLSFFRVLRLVRIFRVFRLGALSRGTIVFLRVFAMSTMGFITVALFTIAGVVILGTVVYYCERGEWDASNGQYIRRSLFYLDDDSSTPFTSIPTTFWYIIVTFTTVGYGDMTPTTELGQAAGALTMYFGIFLIAMPITLISTNFAKFVEEMHREDEEKKHMKLRAHSIIAKCIELRELQSAHIASAFKTWRAAVAQSDKSDVIGSVLISSVAEDSQEPEMQEFMRQITQQLRNMHTNLSSHIATMNQQHQQELQQLRAQIAGVNDLNIS